ncbi:MAG: response regulator, partial [Candidatus Uhrbacteria bacterium]|nr:response regulator [Candidatus Uhrbacteria bacterium]
MKHILLIEDDKFLADIYARHFREAGFHVRHASSGEEGFESALKDPPDMIVLAIALPKKNGFEILEELKTHTQTKKIPVMML